MLTVEGSFMCNALYPCKMTFFVPARSSELVVPIMTILVEGTRHSCYIGINKIDVEILFVDARDHKYECGTFHNSPY